MRGNNFVDYIKSLQDDIYYSVLDSIWRTGMPYSKSKLLCCFCYNLFFISFCLLDSTCHVHCRWMAKNEGTIIFESMQGYYSETAILCSFPCINYTRRIFYITGMYKQIYVKKVFFTHILMHLKFFIDCFQGGLVQKFAVSVLSIASEWIIVDCLFLGRGVSSERHSMGQTSVFIKIFSGLCCLQHNDIFSSISGIYHGSNIFTRRSSKQQNMENISNYISHYIWAIYYKISLICTRAYLMKIKLFIKFFSIFFRVSIHMYSTAVMQCSCSL